MARRPEAPPERPTLDFIANGPPEKPTLDLFTKVPGEKPTLDFLGNGAMELSFPRSVETFGSSTSEKPMLNLGGLGAGGGIPMSRKQKFSALRLDFPIKDKDKEEVDMDKKFNEIMQRSGRLIISGKEYKTNIEDMESLGELGSGTSGHVVKMRHKPTNYTMAVKQMRRSGNQTENKRIIMDLDVVLKSHDCPFIVQCLGCFITSSDVWICMEMMHTCMDKLLKRLENPIPESILGKVAMATVKALNYLKTSHKVIHRDVKPSNILLDEKGNVKLCDFGISGRLVESKANTRNAGCTGYMAPERIDPPDPSNPNYDIRSDVWSLGITLVELATGKFPYGDCRTDFEVMAKILKEDPPSLPAEMNVSEEFRSFVDTCLIKDYKCRPKYTELLKHQFIKKSERSAVDVRTWYNLVMPPPKRNERFSSSLSFQSNPLNSLRSSGRVLRNSTSTGSPSPSGSNSFVTTPGSVRPSRYEEWVPSTNRRTPTPSTPGTPSPNTAIPPEPPPRFSRMSSGSDGLRTPTNSSSSSSGGNNLTSPSPTSVSMSSPSPEGPPPPIRREQLQRS